jgi:HK97 family phage major capsid protein
MSKNYADLLRDQVDELEAEREALKAELADLIPNEERTAEQVETRATEITERAKAITADVAAKIARIAELDAVQAERVAAPKGPNFIKQDTPDGDNIRTMNTRQMVDATAKLIESRDIDPTYARKLLKRHGVGTMADGGDREWLQNLAVRATEAYTSGWAKLMMGREAFLSDVERAAVAVGTNSQGGYLVPTHLDPTLIITNSGTANAIRPLARVVTLGREKTWNGVSTAGSDFSWDGEIVEVSDDSPTFAQPTIPTFVGAGFIQASFQAFEDIENLASDVMMLFSDGRDRLEAAAHATGNGTTAPKGIFTACDASTYVEVTSGTAAAIALVDLQGLRRAVPQRYRGRSTWVMNPVYGDAVKVLGTALSASYTTDGTQANTDRLLGSPVVETDDAPSTQTTTVRDNEIVIGDFSQYVIVDKPGSTTLDFIPNLFNTSTNLPDGRRGWYMRFRSGADVTNVLAFRLLQDRTSA